MIYTVFLAVCLSGTPIKACNSATAVDWFTAPEPQRNLAACMSHGQQFAAGTIRVSEGTYLKVFCRPQEQPRNVG